MNTKKHVYLNIYFDTKIYIINGSEWLIQWVWNIFWPRLTNVQKSFPFTNLMKLKLPTPYVNKHNINPVPTGGHSTFLKVFFHNFLITIQLAWNFVTFSNIYQWFYVNYLPRSYHGNKFFCTVGGLKYFSFKNFSLIFLVIILPLSHIKLEKRNSIPFILSNYNVILILWLTGKKEQLRPHEHMFLSKKRRLLSPYDIYNKTFGLSDP